MKVSFINLLLRNVQTGHEALQKENNTYTSMINPVNNSFFSVLHTCMTTSSARGDEEGEIFGKVMLSDRDRLFCLDFLSLSELQFK
jgi:hypothetical protein